MQDLITWSGCSGATFFVKSNEIRGIKGLTISANVETKDKTSDGEKYTSRKNNGSYQITMTAVLSAPLGVDVQAVAMNLTEAARRGDAGYFYTANAKLFPSQFIATNATVSNITMTGSGIWTYCEVALTLKQSGKFGDGSSSGGSGGGSGGTKKPSTSSGSSSTNKNTLAGAIQDAVKNATNAVKDTVKGLLTKPGKTVTGIVKGTTSALTGAAKKAGDLIKNVLKKTTTAKKASAAAKKNLTSGAKKKASGGGGKMKPATKVNLQ